MIETANSGNTRSRQNSGKVSELLAERSDSERSGMGDKV